VGVAPDVLQPLTKMLIDDDVARINVLDIPEKSFSVFADRKALGEVFPDLAAMPADTQVWAELRLVSPISIKDGGPTPPAGEARSALAQQPSDGVRVTAMKANPAEPLKSSLKTVDQPDGGPGTAAAAAAAAGAASAEAAGTVAPVTAMTGTMMASASPPLRRHLVARLQITVTRSDTPGMYPTPNARSKGSNRKPSYLLRNVTSRLPCVNNPDRKKT